MNSLKRNLRELKELQDLKEQKERHNSKKKLQVIGIERRYLSNSYVFVLKGDAVVCFNQPEASRFSKLNLFKQVESCEISKQRGVLELTLSPLSESISQFGFVIDLLMKQTDIQFLEFAQLLKKHQIFVNQQKQLSDFLKQDKNYHLVIKTMESDWLSFEVKIKEKIKSMEDSGQIKFYTYKVYKANPDSQLYEMKKYCLSELFLALMGVSVQQAQQFILRKGIFDTTDMQQICLHMKLLLEIRQANRQTWSQELILRTFDGIFIPVTVNYFIFNISQILGQATSLFDRSEFVYIMDYSVSDNMLNYVKSIRESSNFSFSVFENENDWDYSSEVHQFLNKYYQDSGLRKKRCIESSQDESGREITITNDGNLLQITDSSKEQSSKEITDSIDQVENEKLIQDELQEQQCQIEQNSEKLPSIQFPIIDLEVFKNQQIKQLLHVINK